MTWLLVVFLWHPVTGLDVAAYDFGSRLACQAAAAPAAQHLRQAYVVLGSSCVLHEAT